MVIRVAIDIFLLCSSYGAMRRVDRRSCSLYSSSYSQDEMKKFSQVMVTFSLSKIPRHS